MKIRMFSQKLIALGILIGAAIVATDAGSPIWQVNAADDENKSELSLTAFMRKKLDASSQILEGLTTEDAGLISKGTNALLQLSKAERWNILTDAEYRTHSAEFRATLRKLADAAEKGNFDNAALQWFDTTKGCIECHQHVRHERAAKK